MDMVEPEPPVQEDTKGGPAPADHGAVPEDRGTTANYCAAQEFVPSGALTSCSAERWFRAENERAAKDKEAAGPRSRKRRALTPRQQLREWLGGGNYAHFTRIFKVAERFSDEQLKALEGRDGCRQKDLFELSRIDDDRRMNIAIDMYIRGANIGEAIQGAVAQTPSVVEKPKKRKGADLSDEQWLKQYCDQVRSQIENPSDFDNDALLWRATLEARTLDVARNRKEIQAAFLQARSPFADLLRRTLFVAHPRNWRVCGACGGHNKNHPDCWECHGRGYVLQTLWPE